MVDEMSADKDVCVMVKIKSPFTAEQVKDFVESAIDHYLEEGFIDAEDADPDAQFEYELKVEIVE